jgi:hypothetical protein
LDDTLQFLALVERDLLVHMYKHYTIYMRIQMLAYGHDI